MRLIQLYYTSESLLPSGAASDMEILELARHKNGQLGVTGFLLRAPHRFGQLLEGPEDAVLNVFARIQTDPRHKGIRHIIRHAVSNRCFPDWSMGFVARSDAIAVALANSLPDNDADFVNVLDRLKMISDETSRAS